MIRRDLLMTGGVALLLVFSASTLMAQDDGTSPAAIEASDAADTGAASAADYEQIDEILEGDEEVLSGGGYSYDPAGRRDPFQSLLQRRRLDEGEAERPEGVPGLLIDEIELNGIFDLEGRAFAQVQVGDQDKAYIVEQGDLLYDGEVVRVTRNEVVFKQRINDPSIIKPFREVVKKLNPEP